MTTKNIEAFAQPGTLTNPFPGLRPFEYDESHLFFGRDDQSEGLITKLARTRFLAVVGTSGSGKSSLVRAGLLPALDGGFMTSAGSNWRLAILRSGNDPIGNLAAALNRPDVFGADDEQNRQLQTAITEATLRRGSRGLSEAVRQAGLSTGENLLVVVDQFEELFRFARVHTGEGYHNEAAAFVKLLLEAPRQTELNVYVVLTMRSDYLGDCAQFWGLPEAINESQYLIPRLTRDQMRDAITGPAAVGGGQMTPRLENRLLNDVGDNPDQLPILQHALLRTWNEWQAPSREHRQTHQGAALDLCCYEAIGGMANALSTHANEAFNELPDDRSRRVAERLFKCLTEKGPDNREVRRPATLGEICAVVEATPEDVVAVIETFRRPGRSFLMPPAGVPLHTSSLIDISHESLIRNWKRLYGWVGEEAEAARVYKRLAETAALHKKSKAGLWRNPDLQLALGWQQQQQPNQTWAERYYPGDWETAQAFLKTSAQALADEERRETERRLKQKRHMWIAIIVLLLLCAIAGGIAIYAEQQRTNAEQRERINQRYLYAANINLAQKSYEAGEFARAADLLEERSSEAKRAEQVAQRGFEWHWLRTLTHNELDTIQTPESGVAAVAFTPHGQWLATSSHDGTVQLWDMNTRRQMVGLLDGQSPAWMGAVTLAGPQDRGVWTVAFAPDGRTVAAGGHDRTVKLWKVAAETWQEVMPLTGHTADIWDIAFAADGQTMATGSGDTTIKLWNFPARQELSTLNGHQGGVYTVAFAPTGHQLASGGADKTVKLWDARSGRLLMSLAGHQAEVYAVQFSPDGKLLATAGVDRTIKLWDVKARREIASVTQSHGDTIRALAFSPDGKLLASASNDGSVRLWDVAVMAAAAKRALASPHHSDLKAQGMVDTFAGHNDNVSSVVFAPDGLTLASGSRDGTVKLWDTRARLSWTVEGGHRQNVHSIAYSPDGALLATASADNTVKLMDGKTGHEQATLTGHSDIVWATAFSPDVASGGMLASASKDKTIRLWDVSARKELSTLNGHTLDVAAVAFSADGKLLASGSSDHTVRLWDVHSRQELAVLTAHVTTVLAVAFSPDGRWLASGDYNAVVRLWDVAARKLAATLKGHEKAIWSLSFAPDGKTLATGSADKRVKLWDVAKREELDTRLWHLSDVWSVVFSPDGKVLASSSEDKTIKLWDVETRQELLTLADLQQPLRSIAFAPDSKALVGAGAGGYFRILRAEPVHALRKRMSLDK